MIIVIIDSGISNVGDWHGGLVLAMGVEWWNVTLQAVNDAQSLDALDEILQDASARIGGDRHALFSGTLAHDARQFPGTIFQSAPVALHRYPADWVQRYHEEGYYRDDPVVAWGLRSVLPFSWSDLERTATGRARMILTEARNFGLGTGVSASCHGHDGTFSIVSITFPEDGPRAHANIVANNNTIHLLASYLHNSVVRLTAANDQRFERATLSRREQEVLRWLANGKTYSQIAQLLGISERTVREHLDRAANKLEVDSKSQLLTKAVARGLMLI